MVTMDIVDNEVIEAATSQEMTVLTYASLLEEGEKAKSSAPEFIET